MKINRHTIDPESVYIVEDWGQILCYDKRGVEWSIEARAVGLPLDKLAALIRKVGSINLDKPWVSRIPYGSISYQEEGCEEQLAWEEQYGDFGKSGDLSHIW